MGFLKKQINLKVVLMLDYNFADKKEALEIAIFVYSVIITILEILAVAICLSYVLDLSVNDLAAAILFCNSLYFN